MTTVLLIGSDEVVLEGVAQAIGSAGFRPVFARTVLEAAELARREPPLLVLAERSVAAGPEFGAVSLAPGTTLVVYRTDDAQPSAPLPPPVQRATLADLSLPLERQRLMVLLQFVAERARASGRLSVDELPERRIP